MAKKDRSKPPGNKRHDHSGHRYGNHCKKASPTFTSWVGIRQMCTNPRAPNYRFYGGRGITLCGRWMESFEEFLNDMGEKPEGSRLCRINKDGDFTPENCEWRAFRTCRAKKLAVAGTESGSEPRKHEFYFEWQED